MKMGERQASFLYGYLLFHSFAIFCVNWWRYSGIFTLSSCVWLFWWGDGGRGVLVANCCIVSEMFPFFGPLGKCDICIICFAGPVWNLSASRPVGGRAPAHWTRAAVSGRAPAPWPALWSRPALSSPCMGALSCTGLPFPSEPCTWSVFLVFIGEISSNKGS